MQAWVVREAFVDPTNGEFRSGFWGIFPVKQFNEVIWTIFPVILYTSVIHVVHLILI